MSDRHPAFLAESEDVWAAVTEAAVANIAVTDRAIFRDRRLGWRDRASTGFSSVWTEE